MLMYGDPKQAPEMQGTGAIPVEVDPEILDLVPIFLENRRSDLTSLREALESGDTEVVEELGHRLKGMGGGYGFEYVSRAGAAMEKLAAHGRLDDVGAWVDALAEYLERVEPRKGPAEPA